MIKCIVRRVAFALGALLLVIAVPIGLVAMWLCEFGHRDE
jgi:hypothetical protein